MKHICKPHDTDKNDWLHDTKFDIKFDSGIPLQPPQAETLRSFFHGHMNMMAKSQSSFATCSCNRLPYIMGASQLVAPNKGNFCSLLNKVNSSVVGSDNWGIF